ncbi:MAG: hypothetical protein ACRBN8_40075 [Nannocystales bacterium]
MALIDDVKKLCDRLAPRGWGDLLKSATGGQLDIAQPDTAALDGALRAELSVVRKDGLADFSTRGTRGVTPGQPARSLLYHVLASPSVHPKPLEQSVPEDYATLDELDTLENYIYSLVADRTDLGGTVVAVFAYQYRTAQRTSHRVHADLAFSRTGVARVGTRASEYDPGRRSFWVTPADGAPGVCVLPARYGVFLARRGKPGQIGTVQGGHRGALDDDYLFPVHKLFEGEECLSGCALNIDFSEYHRNEKLRRAHELPVSEGGLPTPAGFDHRAFPYVRDSRNGGNLVTVRSAGASALLTPVPGPALIRTMDQHNTVRARTERIYFRVPAEDPTLRSGRGNRFVDSSFQIPAYGRDRIAPEYVHMRHRIDPAAAPTAPPQDLNLLPSPQFEQAMALGGYDALHYVDDSCDGYVGAVVHGGAFAPEAQPAFSLVSAPDFMPLADQVEVEAQGRLRRSEPLSFGRLPVNPTLPDFNAPQRPPAFDRDDTTVTAIVGSPSSGDPAGVRISGNRMVSSLPDSASNVFAPGWDASRSRSSIQDSRGSYLTSAGLGSPFPEDAKLCAALSSFWPAVAPDNARTFGNPWPNQVPMLDEELGFHPDHDEVGAEATSSYRGWDGEYGPFFEEVGGVRFVNFVPIERSDYINHALANRIRVDLTAEVQSAELIARNEAINRCAALPELPSSATCLVVFRKVKNWPAPELTGGGYLAEFAVFSGGVQASAEVGRVRRPLRQRITCAVAPNGISVQIDGAPPVFRPEA